MPLCDHNYLKHYTIKENDKILDLGASLGEFELDNLKELQNKNCNIVCVEPTMWCLDKLVQNMQMNFTLDKFMILSVGTYKYDTNLSFENTTAHVLNCLTKHSEIKDQYGVSSENSKVPVISLDTLLSITGEIDFCKCDIEGSELDTFLNCMNIKKIKNLAIAAYHIVDNQETWIKLKYHFDSINYEVIYEKEPYLDFVPQSMIYCKRK